MKAEFFLMSVLSFFSGILQAQDFPLIPDHPGTFKLIDWGVYTHYECGFTKTETTANYQKITNLTDLVRKNPVFTNQKGFECETYVYAKDCPDKAGYGIPSELSFGFCDYFSNKGKVSLYRIEPPSWKLQVNHFGSFANGGKSYSYDDSKPTEPPKEGFNFEKWKSASTKTMGCFCIPGPKEVLGNGIDRYGSELVVIYNPERPPYYLPVKFRDLAEALIEYWKLHPDKIQSEMMTQILEAEYAQVSEIERDGWAYNNTYDNRLPLMGITPVEGPQPVVRLNPDYWNRKLSKSSIQVITFSHLADTKRYKSEKEKWLKSNSPGFSLNRFLEAFDIYSLTEAIEK